MAEMAVQRGGNVGSMLAGCGHAVAGRAVVDDTGVIEHRADERTGVVTDTAILVGRYMANRFSDREHAVVTRTAIVDNSGMIKRRRYESRGHVTHVAVITGRYMIRRRGFTLGRRTVMAGCAVVNDAGMIESGAGKCRRDMTQGAVFRCR